MRYKNKELEKNIIEAAKSLFLEKGIAETSMEDIKNVVGVKSPATIYNYFPLGKKDLVKIIEHRITSHEAIGDKEDYIIYLYNKGNLLKKLSRLPVEILKDLDV